jgi:putative transposase
MERFRAPKTAYVSTLSDGMMAGYWLLMGGRKMPKKYFKAEEIINILRQIEILVGQGQTAQMAARGVGNSEQTYYCWRKEYGGMRTDQAQRLKELEQENSRLKRIVADLSLDNMIIKEALRGKLLARSDGERQ